MTNDVAIYLDLDNVVIGAKQVDQTFDINLVLEHIKKLTNGRIVLRRSYGDWRQNQKQLKDLTKAGFTTQSHVRLNQVSKNLADMQIVVDTMDTLVDGHQYNTYVLITGDRDFTPLVQSLRKRGKQVIGVGIRHATSKSFADLCDIYVYYEELLPQPELTVSRVEDLLGQAANALLNDQTRVRASVLRQKMQELSGGVFDNSHFPQSSFSKFLEQNPSIVEVQRDGTTLYVRQADASKPTRPYHLRYRTELKQRHLRVVLPAKTRIMLIKALVTCLQGERDWLWRELIEGLVEKFQAQDAAVSKNAVNSILQIARQANVIMTRKGMSLATAPVKLKLGGSKISAEALVRCDAALLREILALDEPFDIDEAALALYEDKKYVPYLQSVLHKFVEGGPTGNEYHGQDNP